MEITKTLYAANREEWANWLAENYDKEDEIWLVYYKKHTGQPRIPYEDAVEEALCFGWIDSTIKGIDNDRFCQRFTPRRKNSVLSALNRERVIRLIKAGKMNQAGLDSISHAFNPEEPVEEKASIANDILLALKKDPEVWQNFLRFPESYKRIRIGWIEGARSRDEVFNTRLRYFIRMTKKNKIYGMGR